MTWCSHLVPLAGQCIHLFSKMSQHLLDGLEQNVVHLFLFFDIDGSQRMNPNDSGDPCCRY